MATARSDSWSRVLPSMKEMAGHGQDCVSAGSFRLEETMNFPSDPSLTLRSPFSLERVEEKLPLT